MKSLPSAIWQLKHLRYGLISAARQCRLFGNRSIWQNKLLTTNIPFPSFPASHKISAISTKLNSYHPASRHGPRATGKMFLLTQVLSSSRIKSTSKHTRARLEIPWDKVTSALSCLSVCSAVAKESRKIPHLCKDTVVRSNQCKVW